MGLICLLIDVIFKQKNLIDTYEKETREMFNSEMITHQKLKAPEMRNNVG